MHLSTIFCFFLVLLAMYAKEPTKGCDAPLNNFSFFYLATYVHGCKLTVPSMHGTTLTWLNSEPRTCNLPYHNWFHNPLRYSRPVNWPTVLKLQMIRRVCHPVCLPAYWTKSTKSSGTLPKLCLEMLALENYIYLAGKKPTNGLLLVSHLPK